MDFKISPIVIFVATLIVYVATLQIAGASLSCVIFVAIFLPCLQFLPFDQVCCDKVYECRDINACWSVFKPCRGFVATFLSYALLKLLS